MAARRLQNERSRSGLHIVCLIGLSFSPAPPAAGFLVSESLLTQSFGIDRAVASCNPVAPRSLQTADQFIFYTYDGREVPISSWDDQLTAETAARATTFTFYTHDGRAVTAVDHVFDRQKQTAALHCTAVPGDAWIGIGYTDTRDPGLSILRSRYPSQTQTHAQVRPMVPSVSRTNFEYLTLPYASGVTQWEHAITFSSQDDQAFSMQIQETDSGVTLRLRGGSTRKWPSTKPPSIEGAASSQNFSAPAPPATPSTVAVRETPPGGPGVSDFAQAGAALSSKETLNGKERVNCINGNLVPSTGPNTGTWRAGMKPTPPIVGARKLMRSVSRALDGGAPKIWDVFSY
jgi:hypothetical protein